MTTFPPLRAFALAAALAALASRSPAREVRQTALDKEAPFRRALWVTRWEYKSPEDIEKICYNAASARFTDVLFQVRGAGTVCFKSPYEPWGHELSGRGIEGVGIDPGWDPLAAAIKEGHRRGLRVHAWINVMPGWGSDVSPPKSVGQLYTRRPSWFMVDASGRRMTPAGFYAFLDPGLPEVRQYLALLIGRLVQDYAVDGVHLDYIRYPFPDEAGREFSFHPDAVAVFRKRTGHSPQDDPEAWSAFKREQIAATIRGIRKAINENRPSAELTSTTIANRERALKMGGQDAQAWLDEGLVDAVVPMAYVQEDMDRFLVLTQPYFNPKRHNQVWVGIWPRESNNPGYIDQVRVCAANQAAGVAIFSYGELFHEHQPTMRSVKLYQTFVAGSKTKDHLPQESIASAPSSSKPVEKPSTASASKPSSKPKVVASKPAPKKEDAKPSASKPAPKKDETKKPATKVASAKPAPKKDDQKLVSADPKPDSDSPPQKPSSKPSSKPAEKKDSKPAEKKDSKPAEKKDPKPAAKSSASKSQGSSSPKKDDQKLVNPPKKRPAHPDDDE